MKTRLVIYGFVLVIIISVFLYLKNTFGWLEFRNNNYTKKEFKSMVQISKKQYSKDSLVLVSIIRERINNHKEPYSNAIVVNGNNIFINDSSSRIHIDSIFYSPNFNKIAFSVIVENDNKKLYKGITKEEANNLEKHGNLPYEGSHFDGNSFIGKKTENSFDVYFYKDSFTNSKNYKQNSILLREATLNRLEKNNTKKSDINFDDIRFWNSKGWQLISSN